MPFQRTDDVISELNGVISESEARHDLVNQLVEQSLAQQEQWNKEKSDLISSWGVDTETFKNLDALETSDIAISLVKSPNVSPLRFNPTEATSHTYSEEQVRNLENALAASNKQCSVFLLELEKCRFELSDANSRISYYAKLQEAVSSISEEAIVVKSRSEQAVQELYSVRTERDALLSRLHDAEVEIDEATQEVLTTNTVHQSLWARVKELEADIRSMSREWVIKLEESEAANKILAEDLMRSRSECESLKKTINADAVEIASLTKIAARVENDHDASVKRAHVADLIAESGAIIKLEELQKVHSSCIEKLQHLSDSVDELEEIKLYLESDNEAMHLSVIDKVGIFNMVIHIFLSLNGVGASNQAPRSRGVHFRTGQSDIRRKFEIWISFKVI